MVPPLEKFQYGRLTRQAFVIVQEGSVFYQVIIEYYFLAYFVQKQTKEQFFNFGLNSSQSTTSMLVFSLVFCSQFETWSKGIIRAQQITLLEASWPDFFFSYIYVPVAKLIRSRLFPVCSNYKCVPQFFNTDSRTIYTSGLSCSKGGQRYPAGPGCSNVGQHYLPDKSLSSG